MLLKFQSLRQPVQLAHGMKVLPHLMRVFARWPYREIPKAGTPDALINVLHQDGVYEVEAPWLNRRLQYDGAADLAQGLATQVAREWFAERRGLLWLEAAAAAFDGQIVVFVGGPRSGKSLLAASLAVNGNPAFADSILPVAPDSRQGFSLGMAPQLKFPLPVELQEPLRSLIKSNLDTGSDAIGYLRPGDGSIAGFSEKSRIRAFVMLDRSASQPTSLNTASGGKLIKRLLLNSFGEGMTAEQLLASAEQLVEDTPCYRLTWSDPQEAVNALRARFAAWRTPKAEIEEQEKPSRKTKARRRPRGPQKPAGRQFRHRHGLTERTVDADLFLVGPGGQTIYHLNGLGAGLWQLLDGSHGLDDVMTVLKDAFPEVDSTAIESDVHILVQDLCDRGLLVEKVS